MNERCAHSSSVRSLGYRKRSRLYFDRFLFVHIDGPTNHTVFYESQPIHEPQQFSERTPKDTHNNNCYDSANRRGLIVVPIRMERIAGEVEGVHFGIGDLDAFFIGSLIER